MLTSIVRKYIMTDSANVLESTTFTKVSTGNSSVWMYRAECTYARFNKVKLYFENNGLSPYIGRYENGVHTIAIRKYSRNKFERMERLLNL